MSCDPRWATQRTPSRATLGGQASKIFEVVSGGTPLMPWQRSVFDTALEVDSGGRFFYRDVIVTVPRQSGKTSMMLTLILLRALGSPDQVITYTAQNGASARKKWTDTWLPILQESPFGKYFTPRRQTGSEALLFTNGSVQSLLASTEQSGHGDSVDLGLLDEVWAHSDARAEQAIRPAQITRPNPQLWIMSTAGTPARSAYLWEKVETGRQLVEAGVTEGVAYFEWSAKDDADASDSETWRSCMPALGITIDESAVRSDSAAMDANEFARAYLNRWVAAMHQPVIAGDVWASLEDRRSCEEEGASLSLAFDVTPDRSKACIGVAGRRSDGRFHVELFKSVPGTDWIAEDLVTLSETFKPAVILYDDRGQARALADQISRKGVEVTAVSSGDYGAACGQFFDACMQSQLRHRGHAELATALDGATQHHRGDLWTWNRRGTSMNISPLVVITLALWGAQQAHPRPEVYDIGEIMERQWREANDQLSASNPTAPTAAPGGQRFIPLGEMPRRGLTSVADVVARNEPADIRMPNYPRDSIPNDDTEL